MNVIDWLRATADYLVADRPDVYENQAEALNELMVAMDALREDDVPKVATISFSSYLLTRLEDEGLEEFILSRKAASLALFQPEGECTALAHISDVNLPYVWDQRG